MKQVDQAVTAGTEGSVDLNATVAPAAAAPVAAPTAEQQLQASAAAVVAEASMMDNLKSSMSDLGHGATIAVGALVGMAIGATKQFLDGELDLVNGYKVVLAGAGGVAGAYAGRAISNNAGTVVVGSVLGSGAVIGTNMVINKYLSGESIENLDPTIIEGTAEQIDEPATF